MRDPVNECTCGQEGDFCPVHPECGCGCQRHAHWGWTGECVAGQMGCTGCTAYRPKGDGVATGVKLP